MGEIIKYSEVENKVFDLDDLIKYPEKYLVLDLETSRICIKCHQKFSLKKSLKSITFLCGCGCRIIYPPQSNGVMLTTFITKEEWEKKKKGEE